MGQPVIKSYWDFVSTLGDLKDAAVPSRVSCGCWAAVFSTAQCAPIQSGVEASWSRRLDCGGEEESIQMVVTGERSDL